MLSLEYNSIFFFLNDTATTEIYTLSLHDALPIFRKSVRVPRVQGVRGKVLERQHRRRLDAPGRSEEHTSELQSPCNLVCRLLLEKKNTIGSLLIIIICILVIPLSVH